MQRINRIAFRQSARMLRRLMSTETKVASEAAANPASTSTKEAAAQAVKEAPVAKKPIQSGKPSGSPKPPKSPKRGGFKKGLIYGSLAVLGCGGLYRYHTQNDDLYCISGMKGNGDSNMLETLYLVPKHIEDHYDDYGYPDYCDRLIYEIMNNNPKNFKTMEDVTDFFSRWFSTLGLDIDNKAPVTKEALTDLFYEFTKDGNAFKMFIIGERYFHISPASSHAEREATRYFDCQRIRRNKQLLIPMEKVVNIVEELERVNKETYFTSAFIPNFANKMFSSESRAVKKEKLIEALKKDTREGMGVYEFVNVIALVARQTVSNKFWFSLSSYVDRMVGESLFDHDYEEEEEEPEVEEPEEQSVEVEEPVETQVEEVVEEPVKELTLEDYLDDLERVNAMWWNKLLRADFEGLKDAQKEERAIRDELKKMDWWYHVF